MSKYRKGDLVVYEGEVVRVLLTYPDQTYMVGSQRAIGGDTITDSVREDELRRGYYLRTGTVQAWVGEFSTSPGIHHFGPTQYDRDKPIIRDWMREKVKPIIDALNAGTMTEDEARKALDKI